MKTRNVRLVTGQVCLTERKRFKVIADSDEDTPRERPEELFQKWTELFGLFPVSTFRQISVPHSR